jgi:hypothetical protein
MLIGVVLTWILFSYVHCEGSGAEQKPCSFPVPLDLPNRNDRSDQCWLRIEDVELTETVSAWCYVAHAFLRSHIADYNAQKAMEDNVDIGIWNEDPKLQDDIMVRASKSDPKGSKDWRSTTLLDPVTQLRLYVTKNADCRLIMYTRDGMSNYKVNCEKILFYVNENLSGKAMIFRSNIHIVMTCLFIIFVSINIIM